MAIISASRRTDIPSYFGEWFMNRLEEGRLMIRNPVNRNLVSDIQFNRSLIDCIVFWTKNPIPMFPQVRRLNKMGYPYYFQFTVTGYDNDIERNLPEKSKIISAFKELYHLGNQHIIWRYDPIIFLPKYSMEWHLQTFENIARKLNGYTDKCVISFMDMNSYAMSQFKENRLYNRLLETDELLTFCKTLVEIADANGMKVATCAEKIDLASIGIEHNHCIDEKYIEQIVGYKLNVKKDKGQRSACGCVESIDIGTYGTCKNGCIYCYAQNGCQVKAYDVNSPMLCDTLHMDDKVVMREVKSLKDVPSSEEDAVQLSLF